MLASARIARRLHRLPGMADVCSPIAVVLLIRHGRGCVLWSKQRRRDRRMRGYAGRVAPPRLVAASRRPHRRSRHGVLLAGRYRLAEVVGRGATARVWRARDELRDRDVAVKQVDHAHGRVEARLAARVRHPHVTVVHDVVVHDGSDWLVMDYHQGASLAPR